MRGIVALHIDTVEHTVELARVHVHHVFKPVGEVGVFEFLGVGRAHGGHGVSRNDCPLQKVHIAAEFDRSAVEPTAIETEQVFDRAAAVAALIFDIMHRNDGSDSLIKVVAHGLVPDVDRHKRALPVVAVDDVGPLRQRLQKLRHRAGEEGKAFAIVIVAVKLAAAEICLVIDKIPRDAVTLKGKKAAVNAAPRKAYECPPFKMELIAPPVLHALVKRQNDAHAVAVRGERLRKAPRHIGKAARFAKRHRLARHIQNVHTKAPFSRLFFIR